VILAVIFGICYCKGRGKKETKLITSDALLGEESDNELRKTKPEVPISDAEQDLLNVKMSHDTEVEATQED